jgi:hypothetical protein
LRRAPDAAAPANAANASAPKTGAGRAGTNASTAISAPAERSASGRATSCAARSTANALSPATRVTIRPIAVEMRNAGSVVTSALPIERIAKVCSASSGLMA